MPPMAVELSARSRLTVLLEHFATIEDPRDVRRITHPLAEVLLLVVCGTIADCDDYEHIAAWGEAHVAFLRRHLPYDNGVPGGRWLTILMNRINPALFATAFTAWVRGTWPVRRAMAETLRPCRARSRIMTSSPRVTTGCSRDAGRHRGAWPAPPAPGGSPPGAGSRAGLGNFQPALPGRIHSAATLADHRRISG